MTEVERIVTRAKRGRVVFVGVIALLCIAVTFAIVDIGQESRIANVERSTCVKDPAGKPCQRVKRRSDRNRSITDTCIAFWKVGYRCPAPNSGVTVRSIRGGDASQPAHAGQQPAPAPAGGKEGSKPPRGDTDGAPTPHKPGSHKPRAPQPPGNAPTAPASAPPTTPPAPSTPSTPMTPEPEPPGLLDNPALSTICAVADRLAHLC
jgi:hypothetical protein